MDEVKNDIANFLKNIKPDKKRTNHNASFGVFTFINFYIDPVRKSSHGNDQIQVSCYDYDKKYPWDDIFRLSFETIEFRNWIEFKAYE